MHTHEVQAMCANIYTQSYMPIDDRWTSASRSENKIANRCLIVRIFYTPFLLFPLFLTASVLNSGIFISQHVFHATTSLHLHSVPSQTQHHLPLPPLQRTQVLPLLNHHYRHYTDFPIAGDFVTMAMI